MNINVKRWVPGLFGTLAALGVWQVTALAVDSANFPSATQALARAARSTTEGWFWQSVLATVWQWSVGLGLTVVIAIPLGLVIGQSSTLRRYTESSIDFFRSIPPIILLPLVVLLFGTTLKMVALVTFYGAIWPLLIHTIAGTNNISDQTLDTARSFRLGKIRTFRFVILPGALPFVLTGLRISGAIALFIVVAAQLVANAEGLGRDIAVAGLGGDVDLVYGLIVVAGVLGVAINAALEVLQRKLLASYGPTGGTS